MKAPDPLAPRLRGRRGDRRLYPRQPFRSMGFVSVIIVSVLFALGLPLVLLWVVPPRRRVGNECFDDEFPELTRNLSVTVTPGG